MAPRRRMLLLLSALALLVSPLSVVPVAAQAADFTYLVDTIVDQELATIDCSNPNPDGDCSLRKAIDLANEDGGTSVINIWSGIYDRTIVLYDRNSGLPALDDPGYGTTINAAVGGVPRLAINGNGSTLSGLIIQGSDNQVNGLSVYGFVCSNAAAGGIVIEGGSRNSVTASYIGLDLSGAQPATRLCNGVVIRGGGSSNTISGNTISGSQFDGILVQNASDNRVIGNRIGLAPSGITLIGNQQNGINISSDTGTRTVGNTIGGTGFNEQNIISGNGTSRNFAGISISGSNTLTTTVLSNYIGTNDIGSVDLGNSGDGISISGGAKNTILRGLNFPPLLISGNSGYGISVSGSGVNNTSITSVFVGVNGAGGDVNPPNYPTAGIANDEGGIRVFGGPTNTSILGGANRAIIAGNSGLGISIEGASTTTTRIEAVLVGLVPVAGAGNPSAELRNSGGGILIENARSTSVLSSTISGNPNFGLRLSRAQSASLSGNYVGVNLARTGSIANNGPGIELLDGSGSIVSSSVISGNLAAGVLLRGATGTSILSNTITGNGAGGLLLETVGLSLTTGTNIYTNTISGNSQFGLRLSGALTTTLNTNYVGLNAARTDRQPNLGNGIEIFDSRNTNASENYVAGNELAGIVISGTGTFNTTFNNTFGGLSSNGSEFIVSEPNGGPAVRITGGARQTTISGGSFGGAASVPTDVPGILIEGPNTITTTVKDALIGWVPVDDIPSAAPVAHPFGVGISVIGPLTNVQILNNTIRYNQGAGIVVAGNADRVRTADNKLSRNGAGITLVGTSLLTARPPLPDNPGASQDNPNHDIDPPPVDVTTFTDPLRLHVTDAGVVEGYVITSTVRTEAGLNPVSACVTCTIQIFRPGPDGEATSGQGYEMLQTIQASPSTGFFSGQIAGGLGSISELLLVATDGFGNSSEYSAFPVSTGFSLTSLTPPAKAAPGDVVTYTLRLSNTGTLDVTGLRLQTQGTLRDWKITTDPITNTDFTQPTRLEAGSSRLLTVTLTLPKGPNDNVVAGITDVTTVTVIKDNSTLSQSVRLATTVLPRPVLVVSPTVSLGSARPTETVPHTYVIRNDGNVTVTLGITDTTVDDGAGALWPVAFNARSFTVAPGDEARVRAEVTVPAGAQVNKPGGGPVQAITYVTATVPLSPDGYGPITIPFSATTRVNIDPQATITDGNQVQDGAAGQLTVFSHTVRNLSNKATRFCFVWSTNLGSTVTFRPITSNFAIDSSGCFNLDTVTDTSAGRFREARFEARVLVDRRALPGSTETLNLTVREVSTGVTIGSATVTDRINVIYALVQPRIWLPLVRR